VTTLGTTNIRDEETGQHLATVHAASLQHVAAVSQADEHSENGRSEWLWIRLANGDLVLGVFPQGDTYFAVEEDAEHPRYFDWDDATYNANAVQARIERNLA
jgi:hypothetical protein